MKLERENQQEPRLCVVLVVRANCQMGSDTCVIRLHAVAIEASMSTVSYCLFTKHLSFAVWNVAVLIVNMTLDVPNARWPQDYFRRLECGSPCLCRTGTGTAQLAHQD